ncbi:MAG: 3-dehydroquinate synthase [Candidatus Omnitrophica bacterium]|nr:3-dehydroquinate synthase [Candidatus Omnitrophota bacterium]
MTRIKVDLGPRSYFIRIGAGILADAGNIMRAINGYDSCFIVTNKRVRSFYGALLKRALEKSGLRFIFFDIADSESAKSQASWIKIIRALADFDKARGSCIVASLGGGVAGDLSGFAASTYRRGIGFAQIPTTLLAQVDAAIGGKTAIDTDFAKNLIGVFHQPAVVISDISVLRSLPARQIINGLSEVIKYAVIFDQRLFRYLEKNLKGILALDMKHLEYIVMRCSKLKAGVVSLDEREKNGYRSLLNFGHTIGHAVEAAAGYDNSINHGEAVAIGMLAAFSISVSLGMADKSSYDRLRGILSRAGLPVRIKGVKAQAILSAALYDKKTIKGKKRWILPARIGHAVVCHDVPEDIINRSVLGLY